MSALKKVPLRILLPLGLLFAGWVLFPLLAGEGLGFWGAGVCHRIVERSFVVDGEQLPLCVRCTGIYLGFLSTVVVSFLRGRRRPAGLPPLGITILLGLFLAAVGLDGLNSYMALFPGLPHLYEPHHALRLLTGTLEGVALAAFLWPVLHASLWQTPQEQRSIPNLRELGLVLLVALGLGALAYWHPPLSFYPLALLSLAGIFLAMGTLGTMLVAVIAGRLGKVTTWGQALCLFAWGSLVALLEMAALSWVRYALLGSFSFSLP